MMTLDTDRHRLLAAWRDLNDDQRRTLLAFAEFLAQRPPTEESPPIPQEPLPIPKPDHESAVAALKRLKKTYPMIETDEKLLGEASGILMHKVMGTPDPEVITAMENLFADKYHQWKTARG